MRKPHHSRTGRFAWTLAFLVSAAVSGQPTKGIPRPQQANANEELLALPGNIGRPGGRLVVSLRSEPKTLNPLTATDTPSREVIGAMQADLVHINRGTQLTEPALAKSWKISKDGLQYTLTLRQGLRFSDGQPLDADDVLLSDFVATHIFVHLSLRIPVGFTSSDMAQASNSRLVLSTIHPFSDYIRSEKGKRTDLIRRVDENAPELWPLGLTIAVFMPISRLRVSSSGPPELPGLISASS